MTKNKKFIKKEFGAIGSLIFAIFAIIIFLPIGIIYSFGHSIYKSKGYKLGKFFKLFFSYWLNMLYQTWEVVKFLIHSVAFALDLYGNVIAGELIEDIVTKRESTNFGKGKWSISAATGLELEKNQLTKAGKWFNRILSKSFEPDHTSNALASKRFKDIMDSKKLS